MMSLPRRGCIAKPGVPTPVYQTGRNGCIIILDATNRSLEVLLAAAPATSQPEFFASYADLDPSAVTLAAASNAGTASGTTAVTLVAAPGTGILRRQIKYVSIW